MRILVAVPRGQRLGGAEALLHTIIPGARERGHELEFAYLEAGSWPEELAAAGFRVDVLPSGRLREPLHVARTVSRLRRLFASRRPDAIVNWAGKSHVYAAPAAMMCGMRDRVVWFQHGFARYDTLDLCAALLPAAGVLCCSRAAARAQERLWPRRHTFVVPPGVPRPESSETPASLEVPADVAVVGIVGRLQPWKGQDRLLRAQSLLRERGLQMHLLIVGGDSYGLSPEYAAALPSLVRELGLADSVTLAGEVPDAGPYIARMDMLVNASDPEPFGIVLLEAMARGVPVVAVDSGGPATLIEHERTGLLVRSGEPAALAEGVERLLVSPELRERLAESASERFAAEFTDVAVRARFFDLLEANLAGAGSPHESLPLAESRSG